jgi:hypothetical protein
VEATRRLLRQAVFIVSMCCIGRVYDELRTLAEHATTPENIIAEFAE